MTSAKLLFSTNSYTRIHCSWSPKQQPLSFTRFLCLILVTSTISLENSSIPCCTSGNNNFTAISLPSNTPYKHQTTPKNHFSTISNLSWSFTIWNMIQLKKMMTWFITNDLMIGMFCKCLVHSSKSALA